MRNGMYKKMCKPIADCSFAKCKRCCLLVDEDKGGANDDDGPENKFKVI